MPVTYKSSLIFDLFLYIILLEKPIDVTEKLNLFDFTVSPPPKIILYFLCSSLSDLIIFDKLVLVKALRLPEPDEIILWLNAFAY